MEKMKKSPRGQAGSASCLLHCPDDLCSDPQNPHDKTGLVACACDPSDGEVGTNGSLGFAGQQSGGITERPHLNNTTEHD